MRVLPDDLVAKCLAMLPQCDLQEICVCKRWRELRLSSAFRRYRRDGVERVLVATSWDDPEGGGTLAECFALIGGKWRKMANNKVDIIGPCAAAVTFRGELVAARRLGDPQSSGERTPQTMTRRFPFPSCCIDPCKLSYQTRS